jgi:tRNA-dihydrouridine synthase 4
MDFLHTVIGHPQNRQIDFLTIHPRTRRTPSSTPINVEALDILISSFGDKLPILLSGDVFALDSLEVANLCHRLQHQAGGASPNSETNPQDLPKPYSPRNTNLAGFMSARALLANPALFAGHASCPWEAVEMFMRNVARAPLPLRLTLHHLTQMCGPGMGSDKTALLNKKERVALVEMTNLFDVIDFLDEKIAEKKGQVGGLVRYTEDTHGRDA